MFLFIKTTIAGGLLFILPMALLFVLIEKAKPYTNKRCFYLLVGPN